MRLFGHPIHVMLIHFPIALWPAHEALHAFAPLLPPGVSATAGFWLLASGTVLGWFAAFFGASDLLMLWAAEDRAKFRAGLIHGVINGTVLLGFTGALAFEYLDYPHIAHGAGFLIAEGALLVAMIVGNYFGGEVVWPATNDKPPPQSSRL
jgi:uncharacterized membrane protein